MRREHYPDNWHAEGALEEGKQYRFDHPDHGRITVTIIDIDTDGPGVVTHYQYRNPGRGRP